MKKIVFVTIFLMLHSVINADSQFKTVPLKLTIEADKTTYFVGDEIKITYTIENQNLEPIGFYVRDYEDLVVSVTDLSDHPYRNYYDQAAQRMASSLYPNEYVMLKPNEKWQRTQSFIFKKGEIKTYSGTKSHPLWRIVHRGYYLLCLRGCPDYDSILLSSALGKVKVKAKYRTHNPNLKNFTKQDCEKANISLDVFPEDSTSNEIHHSVKCEGNLCLDSLDPISFMETDDLAIFCQHYSAFTKEAWIGTLDSNSIAIELNGI